MQLQAYDFEIEHCKGADILSRFVESVTENVDDANLLGINAKEFISAKYLDKIQTLVEKHVELPDLKIEDGIIYKITFDRNHPDIDLAEASGQSFVLSFKV